LGSRDAFSPGRRALVESLDPPLDWYQNTPTGVRLAIGLGVALLSINLLEAVRS